MTGVGIIGNGMATRVFHVPYITACSTLDLRAVVSRKADAEPPAPGVALVPDAETLLADPDIGLVVVATPTASHVELALQAIAAGKHVIVEKPFALDMAGAQTLIEAARSSGRLLTAFHNRRGDADYLGVKAAIQSGTIGRVVHFESHFDRFRPDVRERWREDGSPGSGIWYDLAPHLVDQAVQIFGAPSAVDGDLGTFRDGSRAPDYVHAVLHYPRSRVILHAGTCVAGGEPRFRVHGTLGSLIKFGLDPQEGQSVEGLRPSDPAWGLDSEPLSRIGSDGCCETLPLPRGCQEAFYEAVGQACLGKGPMPVSPDEILLVQQIIAAVQESSVQGRRIAL